MFIFIFSCEVTEEKIYQPTKFNNKVTNSTKWDDVEHLTYFGLEKLNIPNVSVSVTNIPQRLMNDYEKNNPNTLLEGLIVEIGLNHYQILLNKRLTKHNLHRVLFHELIHLKQSHSGRLTPCNHVSVDFMGKHYPHVNSVPYLQRPWEMEAFEHERYLLRLYNLNK